MFDCIIFNDTYAIFFALISKKFVKLQAYSIICATIFKAWAGVWEYQTMKADFPMVAKNNEGSNPCE